MKGLSTGAAPRSDRCEDRLPDRAPERYASGDRIKDFVAAADDAQPWSRVDAGGEYRHRARLASDQPTGGMMAGGLRKRLFGHGGPSAMAGWAAGAAILAAMDRVR